MTRIATLENPKHWKLTGKMRGIFAAVGGGAALVLTVVMFLLGIVTFPMTLVWPVGAAIGVPIIADILGALAARNERVKAQTAIEKALKDFADSNFQPTKDQYKLLFRAGRAIPFEVNGISGVKITRGVDRNWSDLDGKELLPTYVFKIESDVIDDGTENFDRLLKQAIENNADIKAAAAKA